MNRGLNAATKRRGTLTREELAQFIYQVEQISKNLRAMLTSIPPGGAIIDGITKGPRSLDLYRDYARVVNEAVTS